MTDLAPWLLVTTVGLPLLGAVIGLMLRPRHSAIASRSAATGALGACLAAISLAVVLHLEGQGTVAVAGGTWLRTLGPRVQQIEWGLELDQWGAISLAVLSGLTWLTMRLPSRREAAGPQGIAMAAILFGISGLVASSSLVPMFAFWLIVSAGTLMMSAWSSASTAVGAVRRMMVIGLMGDLLLMWVIMLIGLAGGSNSLVEIRSMALGRLAAGNPAWPELVCLLIVLSSLSRCGVFPLFGWNAQAANWDTRSCIAVYAIGYVPAGVWMLLKCQPLIATSETALSMLSGFGLLAAVLGAFVACAQPHLHQRIGFLVGSQVGVLLTALSSGSSDAVLLCLWHQAVVSITTFLFFVAAGSSVAPRTAAIAGLTGAMAMAGLLPMGGWTQRSLIETASQPRVVSMIQIDRPDGAADATLPTNALWRDGEDTAQNRQMRMWGLIAAQALSAFAVARGFAETNRQRSVVVANDMSPPAAASWMVGMSVIVLVVAGPFGWWLHALDIPGNSEEWMREGIAQAVAVIGLVIGWRSARSAATVASGVSRWESLGRLSREQLYLEQSFQQLLVKPAELLGWLSLRALNAATNAQAWRTLIIETIGRLGMNVEALQVSRDDFYIATILLGTATVLLTLFLVV